MSPFAIALLTHSSRVAARRRIETMADGLRLCSYEKEASADVDVDGGPINLP